MVEQPRPPFIQPMQNAFPELEDAPESASKTPITEEGSPEGQGDSIHIPSEFLQGKKLKEGDELVLKVISSDNEGVEVEYAVGEPSGEKESSEGEGGMSANDEMDMMDRRGGGY